MTDSEKTRANESGTVTWLHLSDLHACRPKTGWEAKGILDKLVEDFEKLHRQYGLTPDLIFFTGDAAFGQIGKEEGKSIQEQFKEAADLLEKIRASFSPAVPIENVFLVPGNHDVNRPKVMSMIHKWLKQLEKMRPEYVQDILTEMIRDNDANWQGVMKPLEDYRQFLEASGFAHLLQDRERLTYGHIRDIKGVKVGIAGLNSAWSCYEGSKKGGLWLAGHWQIQTLARAVQEAQVKIALMHHPFNWFNPLEDPNLKHSVQKNFDFFLHGHEHDDWGEELKRGFITISAGACYAGSSKEMGYNVVRWNVKKGGGTALERTYDPKGEGWIPCLIYGDTADTGGVRALGNKDENTSIPLPEPPTKDEKKRDIPPGSSESRGIFGRQEEIEKITEALGHFPLVGIYGMAGIGKSQVIKEIKRTPRYKDMDYVPCYVNREMDLQGLFRQMARALGCPDNEPRADFKGGIPGTFNFSKLGTWADFSPPCFIHLVDAHLLFENYELKTLGIKEFLGAISQYYPGTPSS